MRVLTALVAAALLTACSGGEPTAAPPSSTTNTTTTTTPAVPTKLAPLWQKRLPALSPRGMCPTEATFEISCFQAILDFRKVVDEIGDQADRMDSRYAVVERAAAEVDEAIEEWITVCVTSKPNTSERIGCLKPLNRVMNGDTMIMAAIHEVESP
jgi:hypothetical protein